MGRALERLALNIEPSALERAIDRAESGTILQSARKAALWDLYARVWQTTGLAAGKGWVGSFCEAGWLHLGAAYDEAAREFRRPPPPPL
jgi:predicted component of type VI protein secretion system